jgi:hypothetical protein
MKAIKIVAVIAAAFMSTAGICHGQQGTAPLKNDDVVQMIGAGLGDEAVIDLIQSSSTQFELSPSALATLKKAKVSARVIAAMKAAEASKQAAAQKGAGNAGAASDARQPALAASSLPPCQPAPSQSSNPAAPSAMTTVQATPSVNIMAGSGTLPLQPSTAQVAQASSSLAGPFANGPSLQSLEKLASSNLNFASLSSKALMFVPQVAVATKLMSTLHHASKPPATTVALGLPGLHAAVAAPTASFFIDVQYENVAGLNPDEYEPALVQLTPSRNFRLIGARQIVQQADGVPQQGAITEKRIEVKVSRLDRGHLTLEPPTPLPAGEYGVVFRWVSVRNPVPPSSAGSPQTTQPEYLAWDFSVPPTK